MTGSSWQSFFLFLQTVECWRTENSWVLLMSKTSGRRAGQWLKSCSLSMLHVHLFDICFWIWWRLSWFWPSVFIKAEHWEVSHECIICGFMFLYSLTGRALLPQRKSKSPYLPVICIQQLDSHSPCSFFWSYLCFLLLIFFFSFAVDLFSGSYYVLVLFNSRPEFTLLVEPSAGDPEYLIAEIKLPGVVRYTLHRTMCSHLLWFLSGWDSLFQRV